MRAHESDSCFGKKCRAEHTDRRSRSANETLGHTEHGRQSQQKRGRVRSQGGGNRQLAHDARVLRRLVDRVSCELISNCSVCLENLSCRRLRFICEVIFVSVLRAQEERPAAGEE